MNSGISALSKPFLSGLLPAEPDGQSFVGTTRVFFQEALS
jgi:hypothetical protein